MEITIDLTKEYGVVLEGGGAKGAYQIGAWKALAEAGVKIKAVAGVSVGALNGALICMDQLEKAEEIWKQISYETVMDIDQTPGKQIKKMFKDHGLDVTPLKNLIKETVDEDLIRTSDRELYITTYSVSDRKLLTVNIKEVPDGHIADFLLASAYFLAFKNEKLHGKRYLDGGGFNNVPVQALLDQGYKDIIIIRIYGLGFDSEKIVKFPEDTNVYHIAPRSGLGGILQFEAKRARRNMLLGYLDGKRFLYGLSGKQYYIEADQEEGDYFQKLIRCIDGYLPYLEIAVPEKKGYRTYTETIFPNIAKKFGLHEEWDYKELYLAVLEALARKLRVNRFCIYQEEDFVKVIDCQLEHLDS